MAKTITEIRTFTILTCYKCGVDFGMPARMEEKRRQDKGSFWCPNGHSQAFVTSTEQILRAELASAKESKKWAEESRDRARRDADYFKNSRNGYKGQLTKIKKRVAHGVCPCCTRTFQDLARHMETEHPDFKIEEADNDPDEVNPS